MTEVEHVGVAEPKLTEAPNIVAVEHTTDGQNDERRHGRGACGLDRRHEILAVARCIDIIGSPWLHRERLGQRRHLDAARGGLALASEPHTAEWRGERFRRVGYEPRSWGVPGGARGVAAGYLPI